VRSYKIPLCATPQWTPLSTPQDPIAVTGPHLLSRLIFAAKPSYARADMLVYSSGCRPYSSCYIVDCHFSNQRSIKGVRWIFYSCLNFVFYGVSATKLFVVRNDGKLDGAGNCSMCKHRESRKYEAGTSRNRLASQLLKLLVGNLNTGSRWVLSVHVVCVVT